MSAEPEHIKLPIIIEGTVTMAKVNKAVPYLNKGNKTVRQKPKSKNK